MADRSSQDFETLLTRLSEIHKKTLETDELKDKFQLMIEADEIRVTISLLDPPADQVNEELDELHKMREDLHVLIAGLERLLEIEQRAGRLKEPFLPMPTRQVWGLMTAQLAGVEDRIAHLGSHFEPRGNRQYRAREPMRPNYQKVAPQPRVREARRHLHPDDEPPSG